MGEVLAVRQLETGAPLAMKVLHSDLACDGQVRERFLREAATARALSSEHVVRVLDVGVLWSGQPYIVMERLEGRDLDRLLAESGPLPIAMVIDLALQACAALSEAHARGIVHRDLKPSNLFLSRHPRGVGRLKIVDFGVSRASWQSPGLTLTRTALGSPPYMGPEQIMCSRDVDARADIWSLGVTLYELLTGRLPFRPSSIPDLVTAILGEEPVPIETLRRDLPPGLAAIIRRCLEKNPDARYPDVRALARDLAACRELLADDEDGDEPTRVRVVPSEPPPPKRRTAPLVWLAGLTMLLAVVSMVLLAFEVGLLRLQG
jgi:serine/threonine-protein kinase